MNKSYNIIWEIMKSRHIFILTLVLCRRSCVLRLVSLHYDILQYAFFSCFQSLSFFVSGCVKFFSFSYSSLWLCERAARISLSCSWKRCKLKLETFAQFSIFFFPRSLCCVVVRILLGDKQMRGRCLHRKSMENKKRGIEDSHAYGKVNLIKMLLYK